MRGNPAHRPPTLSVIIPAFNEADTIRQVVEAVKGLPIDTEIIVVNDGSTDETSEILEQMRGTELKILRAKRTEEKGDSAWTGAGHRSSCGLFKMPTFEISQEIDTNLEVLQKVSPKVVYGSRFLNGKKRAT